MLGLLLEPDSSVDEGLKVLHCLERRIRYNKIEAREALDVTTVILNNGSYAILNVELMRVGVQNAGPKALSMLDLKNPAIEWTKLSEGMGVPAVRVDTAEGFHDALKDALAHKGPRLIEAMI